MLQCKIMLAWMHQGSPLQSFDLPNHVLDLLIDISISPREAL